MMEDHEKQSEASQLKSSESGQALADEAVYQRHISEASQDQKKNAAELSTNCGLEEL